MTHGAGRLPHTRVNRLVQRRPSRLAQTEVAERRLEPGRKILDRTVVELARTTLQMCRGQDEPPVPAGFTVDELPDPTKIDVGFATYRSEVKVDQNVLRYSRELVVKELALKPDQYDALKKLESAITADENSSAVLKRQ